MRRRAYKKKSPETVHYDADGSGQSTPVQSVDFVYPDSDDHEQDGDAAAPSDATRDELEAGLKERGLSRLQRTVILSHCCDKKTWKEIAVEIGRSATWVIKTWKQNLKHLAASKPVKPTGGKADTGQQSLSTLPPQPLKTTLLALRIKLDAYRDPGNHGFQSAVPVPLEPGLSAQFIPTTSADCGHLLAGLEDAGLAPGASIEETELAAAAVWPRLERDPQLAEKMIELRHKARHGRKAEREAARKILDALTRYQQGNRCPIPDDVLASESLPILVTVADLQRAWKQRRRENPGETAEAAVEAIRGQFPPETVEGFTDRELSRILRGDLLQMSARLAEKETKVASESFVRAWRRIPEAMKVLQITSS